MKTIALLTDFGVGGFYVGVMNAVLDDVAPSARRIDVSHGIAPHAVAQASYVLDLVFDWYAPGTVFLVVVDPGVGGARRNLIVETGGRTVVCPDNGVASEVVARHGDAHCFSIDENAIAQARRSAPTGGTFLGRDVFAPAAGLVAAGARAKDLGEPVEQIETLADLPRVERDAGCVWGAGRFVDAFGNVLSNIARDDLAAVFGAGTVGRLTVSVDGRPWGTLRDTYEGVDTGARLAVLNSWDRVEASVNQGSAAAMLGAESPESVRFVVEEGP